MATSVNGELLALHRHCFNTADRSPMNRGRDSALRYPRRVLRRNGRGRALYREFSARFTGGDGAARRPYRLRFLARRAIWTN